MGIETERGMEGEAVGAPDATKTEMSLRIIQSLPPSLSPRSGGVSRDAPSQSPAPVHDCAREADTAETSLLFFQCLERCADDTFGQTRNGRMLSSFKTTAFRVNSIKPRMGKMTTAHLRPKSWLRCSQALVLFSLLLALFSLLLALFSLLLAQVKAQMKGFFFGCGEIYLDFHTKHLEPGELMQHSNGVNACKRFHNH